MQKSNVGVQELLVRGAEGPGLYVGYGTKKLIPLVLETWVKRIHPTTYKPQLTWIDSGNRFDAYHVSRAARQRGLNPQSVLRSIKLARPFTAFQFHEMLAKIPKNSATPPVVVISDLMGLFYDDELQQKDMERAFIQFKKRLSELGRHAIVIALLIDHPVPPMRRHLLANVLNGAKRVYLPTVTTKDPSEVERIAHFAGRWCVKAFKWLVHMPAPVAHHRVLRKAA